MEDTWIVTEIRKTGRSCMDRTIGEAQDAVSEEAVTLLGEDRMGTTAEAEVRDEVVVKTPPPPLHHHQDG